MSDDAPAKGPEGPEPGGQAKLQEAAPEKGEVSAVEASTRSPAEGLEPAPEAGAAEAYHRRARLAEDRLAEVLDAYRKLKVENEGYRQRITKNLERRYDQRRERLLLKFIEILDNLDRALEAAESTYAGEPLIEGLILVRTQLLQTLQEEGLERIPVLGLPYDPNVSEAVETRAVSDPEHHHVVVKELLRGYRLNRRVARASRVVVGEYREEAPKAATTPEGPAVAGPEEKSGADARPAEGVRSRPEGEAEPSLEEIVSRAEAQEALFPEAFDEAPSGRDDEEE